MKRLLSLVLVLSAGNLFAEDFQKQIDAAPSNGIVQLPAGTFALRRGLVLKSGIRLVGAGMDKTILTPERRPVRLDVTAVAAGTVSNEHTFTVKELPENVAVGLGVMLCPAWPPAHIVHTRPGVITGVDREAKTVTVLSPYGAHKLASGKGVLLAGVEWVLAKEIKKGDTEIQLKNAAGIHAGDELALGVPPNESLLNHVFVKAVNGNTLVLEAPTSVDFAVWPAREKFGNDFASPLIWASTPMIHSAKIKNTSVSDLTVRGMAGDVYPLCANYTVAGIHLFDSQNVTLERVAVRDWYTDGFSLQTGDRCRVAHCEATGNRGNGFHPGTGFSELLFENNLSEKNGAGLYFCWSNARQVLRNNKFIRNRGGGLTGLGNPHDQNNLIEKNLIAENGGPGIEINGGKKSGNIIRDNTIENNSQSNPGKSPGIAVYAANEDALDYTITGNIIRDTQSTPTQYVGIEEKNGEYQKKPTRADNNTIRDNQFAGLKTADIVLAGSNTVVTGEAKVIRAGQ